MARQRTETRPCKKHRAYPQHGCPLCLQEIDSKIPKLCNR